MNRNVTATILIVLAIGIYLTFTRGKLAEVNEVRALNDQYLTAIDNADQLIEVRDSVLQDYNNLSQTDRERIDKMIPNTVDNIRLIIDLNSVALRHNFSLRNIKAVASPDALKQSTPVPQNPGGIEETGYIPTPTLDTVTVSFNVTAPYQQFIEFLRDLEMNLRVMDVSRLTVSVTPSSNNYEFAVELKTYWLRQQ